MAVGATVLQLGRPLAASGIGIVPAVLVIGACASRDLSGRRAPSPVLIELGTASYALFLLHLPLMQLLGSRIWEVTLGVALVAVGIAVMVYRLFEAPLERALRRLATPLPERAPALT